MVKAIYILEEAAEGELMHLNLSILLVHFMMRIMLPLLQLDYDNDF